MGFRQKARGKGEGEEKQVYLTSIGNAIIWVHLNLVEISRGRFGRTQFDKLTDHGAPLPLAQ